VKRTVLALSLLAPSADRQAEDDVAKGQKKTNKEVRKPKAEKPKTVTTTGFLPQSKSK
jgi:hypothetical protein